MPLDAGAIDRWVKAGVITEAQAQRMRADLEKSRGRGGSGMLLAAALLNGIVLFLFTRIYGVDVAIHAILALWLVCVLPLAYATRSRALSFASGILFCAWLTAFAFRGLPAFATLDRWAWLSPLVLLGGVVSFSLGGLHYLVPGFEGVARGIRIAGLQAAIVSLFTMTFDFIAEGASFLDELGAPEATAQVIFVAVSFGVVALGATIAGQVLPRAREKVTRIEVLVNPALVGTSIVFVTIPISGATSAWLASAVLFFMVAAVVFVGARRRDRRLVRIGGFAMTVFLALRVSGALWASQSVPVAVVVGAGLLAVGFFLTAFLSGRMKPLAV